MKHGQVERRLEELGIVIPEASGPAAKYTNFVIAGGLMFVSGKGPKGNPRGKLGLDFTTEQGYEFARQAGLEILGVLREALDSLDQVKRVVKLQGFVNATESFDEPHKVFNGTSDLMLEVFGDKGNHARSVFGAHSLRDQLPIVVDSIFEVDV